MQGAERAELTLLPGAGALLAVHAHELPQRDDLCGAFCAALALRAAGVREHRGQPVDQDAAAVAAGSIVSAMPNTEILPFGEGGRRDYRLTLPTVEDGKLSGTTAAGLLRAIEELSEGRLVAIPYRGPWTSETLDGLFDVACRLTQSVTLVANLATRYLWGAHPSLPQLLSFLFAAEQAGPEPDWDVGHFACVVGRIQGIAGSLYVVADTYPSLGSAGVHLQPGPRLAQALERPDMAEGGMIVVASAEDASTMRSGAARLGLLEGLWDNGTVTAEKPT